MSVASAKDTNQVSWFSLGYDIAPFSNSANQSQLFFKSQALINTLNKLCALDSGDVCVTALTGESGSGKSTCLRALNKMRTHYKSMIIQATAGLSPQNLIKAVFRGQIKSVSTSRLPTTEECVKLIKALTTNNIQIRVLIDTAQALPGTTLSLIRKLCSIQSNGSNLQFVLCTNQPKTLSEIYKDDQIISQSIQLNNLTRQETERFINIKLQSTASNRIPQKAPRGFADQVYEQTKGNLYKINETANRLLPNVLKPLPESAQAASPSLHNRKLFVAGFGSLALLTIGIGAALTQKPTTITAPSKAPIIKQVPARPKPPTPERISRLLFVLSHP